MLPRGIDPAKPSSRARRVIEEDERAAARRKAARDEPGGLAELLGALTQGLVSIGIPGGRAKRLPASPAY